ncbi:MAG: ComEC/Rec2 family competence protein [Alphaproteobacteria bacterium]|nr:ComEC/Rec2 family competence protein [Alphaproteobacteria bacterium]
MSRELHGEWALDSDFANAPGRYRVSFGALGAALAEERERWALWVPVGLGSGIGIYFALPVEPAPWIGPFAVLGAAFAAIAVRAWLAPLLLALAVLTAAVGFAGAQLRTATLAAPALHKRMGAVAVTGRVSVVEQIGKGRRLTLDRLSVGKLPADKTPALIRVRDRRGTPFLKPGDWISVRAVLMPPPRAAAPGAFDFARRDYFRRIGAVGFVLSSPEIDRARSAQGGSSSIALAVLRQSVTKRITSALDGAPAAVAAALLTGERGGIPPKVMANIRDSGLAHLLAISGLHLSLVAMILFFSVRAGLALSEKLALRHPIKKWAALAALAGAVGYMLLTGATVPAQRATIMLAIVLLGVLVDRTAISMRLVAWAATAILLLAPESLLSVSFQMSFAAVIALVAVYEALRERIAGWRGDGNPWFGRITTNAGGSLLTTFIAGLATAPFAVFHFNRFAFYGLAANMVAVPLTALWIMPWGLLALFLMPFGLEGLALAPMGWGIEAVIAVAKQVAGWPSAVAMLPAMPDWGLVAASLGGLWLTLWRGRWRLAGVPLVLLGLATGLMSRTPDILISEDGRLLAVKSLDGRLVLSSRRIGRFQGSSWLRRAGQAVSPDWPGAAINAKIPMRCDSLGCIYRARGHTVALVRDPRALGEDCAKATAIIATIPARRRCSSARLVIDRFDLWRKGAHALSLLPGRIAVGTVRGRQGERPWTRRPESTIRKRTGPRRFERVRRQRR